jgi:diacylglycerol kinase
MSNKASFTLSNRMKSFVYAINGLKSFFNTEHNSWIHITAAITAIILGLVLKISKYEWCLLALAIGIVMAAEVFNTSIELLTDIASPEYNEMAKRVKDMSAGAVLIASIVALIIGVIIFIPYVFLI